MEEYRVVIPGDDLKAKATFRDGAPKVVVFNQALRGFEPRVVFPWHLSIRIELVDLIENGMPSEAEREAVIPFLLTLRALLAGPDSEKPNALFLARMTGNAEQGILFRVYDPDVVNDRLQAVIESGDYPRQFTYRMDEDPDWQMAGSVIQLFDGD